MCHSHMPHQNIHLENAPHFQTKPFCGFLCLGCRRFSSLSPGPPPNCQWSCWGFHPLWSTWISCTKEGWKKQKNMDQTYPRVVDYTLFSLRFKASSRCVYGGISNFRFLRLFSRHRPQPSPMPLDLPWFCSQDFPSVLAILLSNIPVLGRMPYSTNILNSCRLDSMFRWNVSSAFWSSHHNFADSFEVCGWMQLRGSYRAGTPTFVVNYHHIHYIPFISGSPDAESWDTPICAI